MQITFNIERLVPRFILDDDNGHALAKAIERGLRYLAEKIEESIGIVLDPMKMPEWRLDEYAGELGCVYDYNGTIDQKRYWVINAQYLQSVFGTKQAIYNFLEGFFQEVRVEEWFEYNGEPYHFRVTVSDPNYTSEKNAWAVKAIEAVKNVRSRLDDITLNNEAQIVVSGETERWDVIVPYASQDDQTAANDLTDWEYGEE